MRKMIVEYKYIRRKMKIFLPVSNFTLLPLYLFTLSFFLTSCSMTKNIPEDDQLFVGLKTIQYSDPKADQYKDHLENTKRQPLPQNLTARSSGAATTPFPGPGTCGYITTSRARRVNSPSGWQRASANRLC